MTVQRLLVLVLSLFMLLVPPAVARALDLTVPPPIATLLQSPPIPADSTPGQDDEVSAIVLAASPELPLPADDDDGGGGDGLNVAATLCHDNFRLAAPEYRAHGTDRPVTAGRRPWSTGPPRA